MCQTKPFSVVSFCAVSVLFFLVGCRSSSDLTCPANAGSGGTRFSKDLSCPANTAAPSFRFKKESNCPANVSATPPEKVKAKRGCPPAAIGAEKILNYLDKAAVGKKDTHKTDPVTGQVTTQAQGIRTGEIERPPKMTKKERKLKRNEYLERLAIEKQLRKDRLDAKRTANLPY